jgi:hypothetical protein
MCTEMQSRSFRVLRPRSVRDRGGPDSASQDADRSRLDDPCKGALTCPSAHQPVIPTTLQQHQSFPASQLLDVAGAAAGHHKQLNILIASGRPIRYYSIHDEQPESQHCRVPVHQTLSTRCQGSTRCSWRLQPCRSRLCRALWYQLGRQLQRVERWWVQFG